MAMKMEMESEADEDSRVPLRVGIFRIERIYKTYRSVRIVNKLGRWSRNEKSPDDGEDLNRLILDCCALSVHLDNEMIIKYYAPVLCNFRLFFPELDSLVVDPIHYLKIVKKIIVGLEARNAIFSDELLLDLQQQGLLTPSMVTTIVAVRSSLSSRVSLKGIIINHMLTSCDAALFLDSVSNGLDAFIHSFGQFGLLAPSLSALVGTVLAAKLCGSAGGLAPLSMLPIPVILSLGASIVVMHSPDDERLPPENAEPLVPPLNYREQQMRMRLPHSIKERYVEQTQLVASTPQHRLRGRACQCVAEGIKLAAAMDLNHTDPTGDKGRAIGEEIHRMIEKWKEEESAMLTKMRAELAERPKKNKLAVSTTFKPNLKKENKHYDIMGSKMGEMVLASLGEFGITRSNSNSNKPSPTSLARLKGLSYT